MILINDAVVNTSGASLCHLSREHGTETRMSATWQYIIFYGRRTLVF